MLGVCAPSKGYGKRTQKPERLRTTKKVWKMITEIPFKSWLALEAQARGMTAGGIFMRFSRGGYPTLKRNVKNKRVIDVVFDEENPPQWTPQPTKKRNRNFLFCKRLKIT